MARASDVGPAARCPRATWHPPTGLACQPTRVTGRRRSLGHATTMPRPTCEPSVADKTPTYLLFQTLLPLFWTLTCRIRMELTRTDVVFRRITMVLFMCRNKSSQNDLKLLGTLFRNNKKSLQKMKTRGPPPVHEGGGAPPYLVGPLTLHRPQLQLHIFTFGEKKNQREGFIAFYDTKLPPSPKTSREG